MLQDSHKISDLERRVASMAQLLNGCTMQQVMDYTGYIYTIPGRSTGYRDVVLGGVSTPMLPWEVTLSGEDNSQSEVSPGLVAGILPSNIFSKFNAGTSLTYWKCRCDTDGKQITAATIVVNGTPPAAQIQIPSALPQSAEFAFAVSVNGKVFRTIGSNVNVSYNQTIVTDKTTPPPLGVPGVDRWYNIIFS